MRTVRRVIVGGRFEPYVDEHGVEVVPGLPDARERLTRALGGVSADLARLPWDWPEDRSWYKGVRLVADDAVPEGLTVMFDQHDVAYNARTGEQYRVVAVSNHPGWNFLG